jgi:hypothetical protein
MRLSAWQGSVANIPYFANDEDDLKSLRRYLARTLSPELLTQNTPAAGDPWIYYKPLPEPVGGLDGLTEGQFRRPSITIVLVRSAPTVGSPNNAARSSYEITHTLVLNCYGDDAAADPRYSTMLLAERTFSLLHGGDFTHAPWRIPMWNFWAGVKLARMMRVLPASLSMDLDMTDDLGKWYRPITMQLTSPRTRGRQANPIVQTVQTEILGA